MFTKAVQIVMPCFHSILTQRESHIGSGACVYIAPEVILTAHHVIKGYESKIRVTGELGFHNASVIYSSEAHDFAVLKRGSLIENGWKNRPLCQFPTFSMDRPTQGASVGYLGVYHRNDPLGDDINEKAFGASYVSYHEKRGTGIYTALAPSFAESGFSGGPVFTTDAQLIGVISHGSDSIRKGAIQNVVSFTMVAPIYPHFDKITDILNSK